MEALVLHMFVIAPLVKWLMSSERRWSKRNGMLLAIAVLTTLAIIQTRRAHNNHFEVLGIRPSATKAEVQSSYRRLSRLYHPDMHVSGNDVQIEAAVTDFNKIGAAQEVLKDPFKRRQYMRFGDFKISVSAKDFFEVALMTAVQCLVQLFFGIIFTASPQADVARKAVIIYVMALFCLDLQMRFGDSCWDDFLSWVPGFRTLVAFEKITFFHGLMPIMLNGSLMIGTGTQKDAMEDAEKLAAWLVQINLELVAKLEGVVRRQESLYLKRMQDKRKEVVVPLPSLDESASTPPIKLPDHVPPGIKTCLLRDLCQHNRQKMLDLCMLIDERNKHHRSMSFSGLAIGVVIIGLNIYGRFSS